MALVHPLPSTVTASTLAAVSRSAWPSTFPMFALQLTFTRISLGMQDRSCTTYFLAPRDGSEEKSSSAPSCAFIGTSSLSATRGTVLSIVTRAAEQTATAMATTRNDSGSGACTECVPCRVLVCMPLREYLVPVVMSLLAQWDAMSNEGCCGCYRHVTAGADISPGAPRLFQNPCKLHKWLHRA